MSDTTETKKADDDGRGSRRVIIGTVTSTALLKTKRRDIARIMTILNGRKAGLETQAQKQAAEAPAAAETTTKKSKTKKSKS